MISQTSKEFVLSFECSDEAGDLATVSSYVVPCEKRSKRLMHIAYGAIKAEWCGRSEVFMLEGNGKILRPTEPVLLPDLIE